MTNTAGAGSSASPGEEVLLVHIGLVAVTVVLGSAGLLWLRGVAWLVEHRVLVPAVDALVLVPGSGEGGLDAPRLAIASALLVAVLACAASAARRALSTRPEDLS